jgi:hypothetical protein
MRNVDFQCKITIYISSFGDVLDLSSNESKIFLWPLEIGYKRRKCMPWASNYLCK